MRIISSSLALMIIFIVVSLDLFSQISFDSIVKNQDGIVVLSKNNAVFTGRINGNCRIWDKTSDWGQVKSFMSSLMVVYVEGYYKNGKEEGLWIYKTEEGRLRGKMNFRQGFPHGKFVIYYLNGKKYKKGKFKKGLFNGVFRTWEKSGERSLKETFRNGIEIRSIKYPNSSPIITF